MNPSLLRRFYPVFFCLGLTLFSGFSRVSAQNAPICFQLFFPTVSAQAGDTVCLPLQVRDFEYIVSMQFVTRWDTAALELLNLDYDLNTDLPGLQPWHFFLNPIGKLAFAWDDINGIGVTLPDSAALFTLCFRVKNSAGGFAKLKIDPNVAPPYEVGQILPPEWNPVFMPFAHQIGGVLIGPTAPANLGLVSTCVATAICNAPNGVASVEVAGGQPPYTYFWNGPNGFTDTISSLSGLSGGLYKVTVTDMLGSTVTAEMLVNASPTSISQTIQKTNAFCNQPNGCATLTVFGLNPPFAFQWSDGDSQTAENCHLLPGPHTVTITDNLGCAKEVPFSIGNQQTFSVGITYQNINLCTETGNASVLTSTSDDYQYIWSTGETTQAINNLEEGRYYVTVTSVGGCTVTAYVDIVDYSTDQWDLELLPACDPGTPFSGSLVLKFNPNNGNAIEFPVTVAWSDGTTRLISQQPENTSFLDTLALIPSGHYAVTLTSAEGCSATVDKVLFCEELPSVPDGYVSYYIKDEYLTPQYATDSCAGVYARNFEEMTGLAFSLTWNQYLSEVREIKNIQLPGLIANNFTFVPGEGKLGMDWNSVVPVTLPNESLLFEVCFDALQNNYPFNYINFGDEPTAFKNLDETGQNQPFIGMSGDVLFGLYFPPGPSVCAAAALPLQCDFDGKGRVLLGSCDPNKLLTGYCSRKDSTGFFVHYGDLYSLLFADAGTYYVTATQAASSPSLLSVHLPEKTLTTACVWPGDADNNNAVNHHDLLYLGLAYGTEGPARADGTLDWYGQDGADWPESTALRKVNFKNIDTNGDGIINAADTVGIVQNWGRVINPAQDNPFGSPQGVNTNSPHPMLSIESDTLEAGQEVQLPLSLGSSTMPMDSVYGLAFSISYDPGVLKDNIHFQPSSSWFGDSTQFLFLQKNFPLQGHLDVAITRTDGIPVSGWGAIGKVIIIIEDNIFGDPSPILPNDTTLKSNLFFSGLHSVNANEKPKAIEAEGAELVIRRRTSGLHESPTWERTITLSPNPAAASISISSQEAELLHVEIMDLAGRLLFSQNTTGTTANIRVDKLPGGTCFVRIFTDKGLTIKKLQITH